MAIVCTVFDTGIAATAVAHEMPIVTRNRSHYARVPSLEVVGYAESG